MPAASLLDLTTNVRGRVLSTAATPAVDSTRPRTFVVRSSRLAAAETSPSVSVMNVTPAVSSGGTPPAAVSGWKA